MKTFRIESDTFVSVKKALKKNLIDFKLGYRDDKNEVYIEFGYPGWCWTLDEHGNFLGIQKLVCIKVKPYNEFTCETIYKWCKFEGLIEECYWDEYNRIEFNKDSLKRQTEYFPSHYCANDLYLKEQC